MIQLPVEEWVDAVSTLHGDMNRMLEKGKLTRRDKALLMEYALALEELLANPYLLPEEAVILRRDGNRIYEAVCDGAALYFYSSFYYFQVAVKQRDDLQQHFQRMNVDIMVMQLSIHWSMEHGFELNSSQDNCFFSRIAYCNAGLRQLLAQRVQALYTPSLYVMANLLQTLLLYLRAGQHRYTHQARQDIAMLTRTVKAYLDDLEARDIVTAQPALFYFLYGQLLQVKVAMSIPIQFPAAKEVALEQEPPKVLLRVMTSVAPINPDSFTRLFERAWGRLIGGYERFSALEKILLFRVVAIYTRLHPQAAASAITFDIHEKRAALDSQDFLEQVFQISRMDVHRVTEQQIAALQAMKDGELRRKVACTIQGVDAQVLHQEAEKPHGSFEIADMELPIRFENRTVYLCMPVKSGVEITGKHVPVEVAYQIFRPFAEFEDCVVVFITAKKCSQNLMNYIKKMKSRMDWPIEVLEERALAALLHLHGQL